MSTTDITLSVKTDDEKLGALIEQVDAYPEGTWQKSAARGHLLAELARRHLLDAGYLVGRRDGRDQGAAPYLEGPWWKRAWTAARS